MHERQPTLTGLMHRVVQQTEKKTLWQEHDGPVEVAGFIVTEAEELQEANNNDGESFEIASEVGDVLYLALKLCADLGIKPEDAVRMKILRNDLKYPTDLNSEGDYEEQRAKSQRLWSSMGGDAAFSHAYLDHIAETGQIGGNGYSDESPIDGSTVIYMAERSSESQN